jgi:hypothetical protein
MEGPQQHLDPLWSEILRQREPDDKSKDGDAAGGNKWFGKGDHDRGLGAGRGDNDRNDKRHVESRFRFNFKRKFHAQMLR